MIVSKIGLVILLFFSAFFSGSETAPFSLNTIKLRKMERRRRDTRTVSNLLREPSRLLITLLIGNTLVNVAISVVATSLSLELFGSKSLGLAIGVVTFLLLVFGEVAPKAFAIEKGESLSLIVAKPLKRFSCEKSGGIPRRINHICDLALFSGFDKTRE